MYDFKPDYRNEIGTPDDFHISSRLFSKEDLQSATLSLSSDYDINTQIDGQSGFRVSIKSLEDSNLDLDPRAKFFRALIIASANHQARRDEPAIQDLFASSANSVSIENVRTISKYTMGNIEKLISPAPNNNATFPEIPLGQKTDCGFNVLVSEDGESAYYSIDPKRQLLPVILAAAKR